VSVFRKFVWIFWLVCTNPGTGTAQTCAPLPEDHLLATSLRYQFRANPPRCEGVYLYEIAGGARMTLVSLTFGKVTYDAKRDQYLQVKLAVEPFETTVLRAVGVPERLYYRLDADLSRGSEVFKLPLGDVIKPKDILANDFGIYAIRTLAGRQNGFIPVYADGSGAFAQENIVAVVRPGADVTDVVWRSYAPNGPPTAWAPVAGASGFVPEGTRLEILLSKNLLPQLTLEVSFRSNGVDRADRFLLLER
jgi:hypothetical protein